MEFAMREPFAHDMLPRAASDERARQNFIAGLKMHMEDNVYPADRKVGEQRVLPRFESAHGRAPNSRTEWRHAMEADPFVQSWSSIARSIQEMHWDTVSEITWHELPKLLEKSKVSNPKGSLHLDPDLDVPRYNTDIDIHCMPGGYHSEIAEDDVFAGAMFDRGAYYYGLAIRGTAALDYVDTRERMNRAAPGHTTIGYLRETYPGFKPKRILDLGCAMGGTTVPYADTFPDADVYGIDVAAPQLRYGHARAEGLGARVHFRQENAEALSFDDESFDLVVSHGLFHETSAKATPRILAECHRVLRKGGVTIHIDTQFARGLDDLDAYYWDWDTHYNAEPFWGTLHHTDARDLLADAGFARRTIREVWPVPQEGGRVAYEPVTDTGGAIVGSTLFAADKH
jgi:ubiquinone/menaquinone biosynthesis C-methylase UbiE